MEDLRRKTSLMKSGHVTEMPKVITYQCRVGCLRSNNTKFDHYDGEVDVSCHMMKMTLGVNVSLLLWVGQCSCHRYDPPYLLSPDEPPSKNKKINLKNLENKSILIISLTYQFIFI